MAFKRMFNLGAGGSPVGFAVDTLPGGSGQIGGVYEDNSQKRYQCFQLVDSTAVAGDIEYAKAHDGSWTATPTIGNSSAAEVAGVATGTVAANQYTLLQQGGLLATKANGVFVRGVPVWPDSGSNRVVPGGVFSGSLTPVTGTTVGGVFQVANPLTGPWLVNSLIINRTTKSTGASALAAGVAVDATTSSNNLLDALAMGGTEANGENNFQNGGTAGKGAAYGAAGSFLNGTASATAAGLVGTYSGTFVPTGAGGTGRPLPIGVAQAAISSGKVSVFLQIQPI